MSRPFFGYLIGFLSEWGWVIPICIIGAGVFLLISFRLCHAFMMAFAACYFGYYDSSECDKEEENNHETAQDMSQHQ